MQILSLFKTFHGSIVILKLKSLTAKLGFPGGGSPVLWMDVGDGGVWGEEAEMVMMEKERL